MARSKKPMDIYEEEMLKLASQMSLAEGFDDIEWDPNNLDVTTDRVRHLEEIVEEHLISEEQILLDEDNRLSAEELTEIFSLNDLSDGLTPNSESLVNNNSTTPGTDDDAQTIVRPTELFLYATDCNNNTIVSDNAYDKNQTNSNSNSNHNSINNNHKRADLDFQSSPTRLRRRGSDRRREEKIKETFSTIGSKLKWLQNKIVQSIDSTVETERLSVLLELNDRVSTVLTKAEMITNDEYPAAEFVTDYRNVKDPELKDSMVEKAIKATNNVSPGRKVDYPTIVSMVYVLRRGGDRETTLTAVEQLIKMCNFGGQVHLAAVKEMMSAGALQSLLSTLSRAGDWPEVELQISKLISVLVTYEDDWALLQRSAYVILSSLYTLQLKTQARAKVRGSSFDIFREPEPSLSSVSKDESESNRSNSKVSGSFEIRISANSNVEEEENRQYESQKHDVRTLVSAAIAKLSLVLSSFWGKDDNFNEFPNAAGLGGNVLTSSITSQSSAGMISGKMSLGGLDKSSNLKHNSKTRAGTNDSSKILKIMLNLIITVFENSSSQRYSSSVDNGFGVEGARRKSATLPNIFGSNTDLASFEPPNSSKARKGRTFFPDSEPLKAPEVLRKPPLQLNKPVEEPLERLKTMMQTIFFDSSTVLCSAALANLAEIPQCRQALVSGGALHIIRTWLEMCADILKQAKELCFEAFPSRMDEKSESPRKSDSAAHSPSTPSSLGLNQPDYRSHNSYNAQQEKSDAFVLLFMKCFGLVYELINNSASALMHLSGGTDCRFQASTSHNSGGGSGGRKYHANDYMVGWIDAQILAEGLPEVIVKVIFLTTEDFTTISDHNVPTRSVLPAAVAMHFSQTIFQLCSRMQNRQELQDLKIPAALCVLFENIVNHVKARTNSNMTKTNYDQSIYSYIFDFGGIYSQGTHTGSIPIHIHDYESTNDLVSLYSTSIDERNRHRLSVHASHMTNSAINNKSSPVTVVTPGGYGKNAGNRIDHIYDFSEFDFTQATPRTRNDLLATSSELLSSSMMQMMISITTSCLNSLIFFLGDEYTKLGENPAVAVDATRTLYGTTCPTPASSCAASANSDHIVAFSLMLPLIDLISCQRMVDSILLATSSLPKGMGRLASIRIISSLTEWPVPPESLFDGATIEVLLSISSEAEDLKHQKNISLTVITSYSSKSNMHNGDDLGQNSMHLTKPTSIERNVSGASSISGSSIGNKSYRSGHHSHPADRASMISLLDGGGTPPTYGDDEEGESALEETLIVCYALANLGNTHEKYAKRMFNSGLFSIMSKLAKSQHIAICREALRCVSAMCPVISSDVLEKAVFFSPRKDSLFVELLDALSWGLRSPHEVVQRDAVYTTSKLAMINEMTQDLVVNGTLRQVISLLTDPTNDRDLRAISEEVLKNVGFHGGKKDFEICGFDYEVLRDWYVMRRALKPQEQAYDLLDAWIKQLFDDQFGDGELHHLRHKNFDPHDCNSLVRSAVSVLRKMSNSNELTEGDSPTNAKSSDYSQHVGGSLKSSTPTANANALAMPHLHRNFTDSFLKYFNPFCAKPPEKVPRHNTELRLDESDYHFSQSPTSDRDFFSPSHGLVHQMNRSLHVPSMAATATSGIQGFIGTGTAGSVAGSASGYHIDYAYDWIDRPPLTSTKLLDLFYTSKLHQHLLMDMNSLGTSVGLSGQLYCGVESDPYGVSSEDEDSEQRAYLLPHPHKISAILLPSRSYLSFALLGRVLEKVFEYEGNQKMWSLTFRDSEYEKDFHTSLISTLRRCPQICSLCFSSTHRVEDGAFLGHLVGQIPASVRFLSFKSTLSKESIQALCILLRTQNAAFIDQGNEGDLFYYGSTPLIINKDRSSLSSYAPYTASGTGGKTTSKTSKTIDNSSSGSEDKYRKANDRGLLGLALTHFTFEPSEVNHILELLYLPPRSIPHRKPSRMGLAGIKTPTGKMQRGSDPNISPSGSGPSLLSHAIKSSANNVAKESLRGLRFIDLSHNNLSDINCANILIAALNGPLEGLELAGNIINRGAKFLEVLESLQDGGKGPASFIKIDHGHHLRYLGISDNNLTAKTTFSVLKSFAENNTLTNLDVSCNELDHSKPTNELLRSFMRTNTTIRVLNLSYTKIDSEGIKAIHLGLLENSTMLMLPLAGNITEDKSSSISLIQVKLKENRMLYKARSVNDHFVSAMNLAVQMNLAGEVTSTDYNGSVVDAGEAEEYRISASDRNSNDESAITATPVSNKMYYSDNVVMTSATLLDSPSTVSTLTPAPTPIPTPLAAESKLSAKSPEKSNASEMSRNNAEDICVSVSELEAYQRNDSAHKMSVFDTKLTNPSEFPAKTTTIRSQSTTVHTTHSNTPTTLVTSTTPTSRADAEARRAPEVQYNYERSRQQRSASYSHAPRNVNGFNLYPLPMTVPVTLTVTMPSADSKGVPERNCMDYRIEHGNQSTHVGRNSGKSDSLPLSEKNVKLHTELTDQSTSLSSTGNASNTLNVLFSAPLAGFDRYSKPHPLEVLDHTGEREMLIQVFKEVHRDISLHFDYATTDSLRTALSFGCRALHFSGHGLPKGLCFEDGRSGLQVVSVMRLKDLLGAGGLNLKFVFVSACYSKEIGEAFVKAGVKHVVCVKVDSKIQDVAAIAFTRAFYVAFLSSRTVEDSFQIAKEALKASPYVPDSLLEGEKFILLPDKATFEITGKDGTSAPLNELHNKVIFQNRTVKNWPGAGQCTIGPNYTDVDAFLTRSRIPSPPTDFVGREVFLHSLIRSILDRRLVSLVGEDGLGKTAVACAACHYLAEREAFSDSIVFLRAKGLKDYRSFLSGLQSAILSSGSNAVSKRLQILLSKEKSSSSVNLIYPEEEQIFACLEPAKLLLAIDKLDDLLSDYGDSTTDFRLFLGRLFETCPNVKILIISTDTLSMHNITIGSGVVEYSVALGPLTLHSSVRMFARLTPSLSTLRDKSKFISSMQPPGKHSNVTVDSRDVSPTALQLLNLFGDGNPSKIIHMACESTPESVAALVNRGQRIIKDSIPNFMPDSDDGSLTSSGTAGAYYF